MAGQSLDVGYKRSSRGHRLAGTLRTPDDLLGGQVVRRTRVGLSDREAGEVGGLAQGRRRVGSTPLMRVVLALACLKVEEAEGDVGNSLLSPACPHYGRMKAARGEIECLVGFAHACWRG